MKQKEDNIIYLQKKRILVFGGTGFIGGEIVLQLNKGVSYEPVSFSRTRNPICKSFVGDVTSQKDIESAFSYCDYEAVIIACGNKSIANSNDVVAYSENDLSGMVNILNACVNHKVKKIVYLSSAALYRSGFSLSEESPVEVRSFYSFIKQSNENLLYWYSLNKDLRFQIIRCFNVTGKSGFQRLTNDFLSLALRQKKIKIFGTDFETPDGTLIRDYIHVSDVASACIKAVECSGSNIFNIGTGNGFSIRQLLDYISKNYSMSYEIFELQRRKFDSDVLVSDNSKARVLLKWAPKYSLDMIIGEMFDYLYLKKRQVKTLLPLVEKERFMYEEV